MPVSSTPRRAVVPAFILLIYWSELTHSTFCTRAPLRLTFNGNERGKTLYFATRWENTRSVKGPWSEIMEAIIP
jgi:hypothetical protein